MELTEVFGCQAIILNLLLVFCIYIYYDDRTQAQYIEHQLIDNDLDRKIDPNKKVVVIGIDGLPIEQFNESIITKEEIEENNLHQYTFDTQSHESKRG
ncbi:hypothetical protein FQA39_LY13001 [Lamprigera yunnana]|nr:hypothetical protein FQA39_LY13001 [Lamprigera yunnana]